MAESSILKQWVIGKVFYDHNKPLGRGTHAVVYRGHFDDKTTAAVKRIQIEFLKHETTIIKTIRDRTLCHENLLKYFTSERDDHFFYLAMELCSGTLEDLVIGSYKGPSPGSMKEVLRQATEGLSFLHSKKILHRNVKPQNVLISIPEGSMLPRVKLADYGNYNKTKKKNVSTATENFSWNTPELYNTDKPDYNNSDDIFCFGCVFGYTLSGGYHPFGDSDLRAGRMRKDEFNIREEKIKDMDAINLIKEMIAYEQNSRPSAQEILKRPYFDTDTKKKTSKFPKDGKALGNSSTAGVKVYSANINGKIMAVKRIEKKLNPEYKTEVDILRDPNMLHSLFLVRYFDDEEDAKYCYISMELCHSSLDKLIEDQDFNPANTFLRDIISGLDYLHEMKIIHRDLKPSNVLVSKDVRNNYVPKLADFGISKFLTPGKSDQTTQCRGSYGWIAPELKPGAKFTNAVDVFAAGCLLFFTATKGLHPFDEPGIVNRKSVSTSLMIENKRQENISSGKFNLCALANNPTMLDLIERSIREDSGARTTTKNMLEHPAFWDIKTSLEYLRSSVDDVFKKSDKKVPHQENEDVRRVVIKRNWREQIETEVSHIIDIGQYGVRRKIPLNGESIYDLLSLIRNCFIHNADIKKGVRELLGEIPDGYFKYWSTKFPYLLIFVWRVQNEPGGSPLPIISNCEIASGTNQNYMTAMEEVYETKETSHKEPNIKKGKNKSHKKPITVTKDLPNELANESKAQLNEPLKESESKQEPKKRRKKETKKLSKMESKEESQEEPEEEPEEEPKEELKEEPKEEPPKNKELNKPPIKMKVKKITINEPLNDIAHEEPLKMSESTTSDELMMSKWETSSKDYLLSTELPNELNTQLMSKTELNLVPTLSASRPQRPTTPKTPIEPQLPAPQKIDPNTFKSEESTEIQISTDIISENSITNSSPNSVRVSVQKVSDSSWNPLNPHQFASSSTDGSLVILKMDGEALKIEKQFSLLSPVLVSMSWEATGNQLAIADRIGNIFMWKIGEEKATLVNKPISPNDAKFLRLEFHGEKTLLLLVFQKKVVIWNTKMDACLQEHTPNLINTTFGCWHGSDIIAISGISKTYLHEIEFYKLGFSEFLIRISPAHTVNIHQLRGSFSGNFIASRSIDNTVKVWKTETSQQTNNSANVAAVAQKKCVSCLSWIPNTDEWIACGLSTGEVIIWSILSGETCYTLDDKISPNNVVAISLSPDGHYISSGHSNKMIKIWSLPSKDTSEPYKPLKTFPVDSNILKINWNSEGNFIGTSFNNGMVMMHSLASHGK